MTTLVPPAGPGQRAAGSPPGAASGAGGLQPCPAPSTEERWSSPWSSAESQRVRTQEACRRRASCHQQMAGPFPTPGARARFLGVRAGQSQQVLEGVPCLAPSSAETS